MKYTAEEREIVANENIKLVHFVVNKYIGKYTDLSELESVALMGYDAAIRTFDKSRGVKFTTHAVTIMHRGISTYLRDENRKRNVNNVLHLDLELPGRGGEMGNTLHDIITDKECDFELYEVIDCIERVISKLDEDEKRILRLTLEGKNQRDITRMTENKSRTWVWYKTQNIRKLLEHELGRGCS